MTADHLLFVYARSVAERRARVAAGEIPSETLYGLPELERDGWRVDVADEHYTGPLGRRIAERVSNLRHYDINLPDWRLLRRFFRDYDAIVMKDDLSVMASVAARLSGTPLCYLDSMFQLPRHPLRRIAVKTAARLASKLISYSTTQNALWSRNLGIPADRFAAIPFGLDLKHYQALPARDSSAGDYVLAIGRDPGRDYATLVQAMEGTGLNLKLVTLPYLLRDLHVGRDWIEVLQDVSYEQLSALYLGATAVVVPLNESYSYPAGIRGMLEAMAVGRPLVVTRTPCLEEYGRNEVEVMFVPPRDTIALRESILRLRDDRALADRLVQHARHRIETEFTVEHTVSALELILRANIGL